MKKTAMTFLVASLVSGDYGATVDTVIIVPVPEPGILSLEFAVRGLPYLSVGNKFRQKNNTSHKTTGCTHRRHGSLDTL
jgi:hypothetical protein